MTIDHRANVAARKVALPDGFVWFAWELMEDPDGTVVMTGCVPSVYMKGPKKGKPKYDGARIRCCVTDAEFLAEKARVEALGVCSECGGDGKAFASWHHQKNRIEWRDCPRCQATGKVTTDSEIKMREQLTEPPEGAPRP